MGVSTAVGCDTVGRGQRDGIEQAVVGVEEIQVEHASASAFVLRLKKFLIAIESEFCGEVPKWPLC